MLKSTIPLLKNIAASYKIPKEDQEDVIQDVLLDFWQKSQKGKVDVDKNSTGFVVTLLKWRLKDRIDKIYLRQKYFSETVEIGPPENKEERPIEQIEILHRALKDVRADKKTKKLHWQIFWHNYKNDDILETAKRFSVDRAVVDVVKCRINKKIIQRAKQLICE